MKWRIGKKYDLKPEGVAVRTWVESQVPPPEWSVFFHGTFNGWCSTQRALDSFFSVMSEVSLRVLGVRGVHLPWIASAEPNPSGVSAHVHSLIAGCEGRSAPHLDRVWRERHGIRRVELFDPKRGDALGYVLKDVGRGALFLPSKELVLRPASTRT
jgi:hypothetical protein